MENLLKRTSREVRPQRPQRTPEEVQIILPFVEGDMVACRAALAAGLDPNYQVRLDLFFFFFLCVCFCVFLCVSCVCVCVCACVCVCVCVCDLFPFVACRSHHVPVSAPFSLAHIRFG